MTDYTTFTDASREHMAAFLTEMEQQLVRAAREIGGEMAGYYLERARIAELVAAEVAPQPGAERREGTDVYELAGRWVAVDPDRAPWSLRHIIGERVAAGRYARFGTDPQGRDLYCNRDAEAALAKTPLAAPICGEG